MRSGVCSSPSCGTCKAETPSPSRVSTRNASTDEASSLSRFKRPAHQGGEWRIAGALKINRVLTPEEVEVLS